MRRGTSAASEPPLVVPLPANCKLTMNLLLTHYILEMAAEYYAHWMEVCAVGVEVSSIVLSSSFTAICTAK